MGQDGDAEFRHKSLEKLFGTPDDLVTPESVVFDPARNLFYVSNFDAYGSLMAQGGQYISKLSVDGEVENLKWVTGLRRPTGMAVHENKLFIVERGGLVEVDIDSGEISARYPAEGSRFLNDITIDDSGVAYVSDSGGGLIYRFVDGLFETWLAGSGVLTPNGIQLDGNKLIVGDNGDQRLKAVDLDSKNVSTIARLGPGIIDGIRVENCCSGTAPVTIMLESQTPPSYWLL